MLELVAVFHGRVQGIGFRAAVKSAAVSLGLSGTICNLADGSVELHAQGSKESLERLLQAIKGQFHLESSNVQFKPIKKEIKGFSILHL